MAMFAAGPAFFLLFMMAGANAPSANDIVSWIDARDYFQTRKIEIKADNLAELAGKEPEDGTGQIAQLLAIRWLGEHPDQAKKATKARTILQEIARGDKAQDRLGFAKEYAQRSLALIDGKPAPRPAAAPQSSLRSDAFVWFPKEATLFAASDLRVRGEMKPFDECMLRTLIAQLIPAREKDRAYKELETLGNMRLDRISFAYVANPQEPRKSRIFLRFTGLGDRARLADVIKKGQRDAKVQFKKGPKGEIITVISSEKNPPAYALIGDTDLVIAGFEGNDNALEALEEALEVRAGKKPNLLAGPFADKLKKIPARAGGLIMGDIPEEARQGFASPFSPFKAAPISINGVMTKGKDIAVHLDFTMASADDAKTFADNLNQLKQQGIDALKKLPPQIKADHKSIELMSKTLASIKVAAKDEKVSSGIQITHEVLHAAHDFIKLFFTLGVSRPTRTPPPAAVKAIPAVKAVVK